MESPTVIEIWELYQVISVVFLQATQAIALTPISGWESLRLPPSSLHQAGQRRPRGFQ